MYVHIIHFVYMNTAVINIRTDKAVKAQFKKIAEELGLGVSSLLNALMRQVIKTKRVELDLSPEIPSPYMVKCLRKSEKEYEDSDYISFDDPKKALKFLDSL